MEKILTGSFTIDDYRLYDFLQSLYEEENIFLEPSAFAGFLGPIFTSDKFKDESITHMCWGTGGNLVPEEMRKEFLNKGNENE